MNSKQKLLSLGIKSVWAYTKQSANFKDLYLSVKLFSEIPDIENANVEQYFADHCAQYGISTCRHRILAIGQMFGLITKSPYYNRGGSRYSDEITTKVFDILDKTTLDSDKFNEILSEQLLKIKIKAIIDTTNCRSDYYIYPFLFLFLVMWKLDVDYSIKLVSMNKIWTYVLTCKSMDDVNDAVSWIADSTAKASSFVRQYKSDSRIMTLIFENTKMFSLENEMLSLNHPIAENFYNDFILKQNLSAIQSYLYDDRKYCDYLINYQGFDFDLTSNPTGVIKRVHKRRAIYKKSSDLNSNSKEVTVLVPDKENSDVNQLIDAFLDMEEEMAVKEASVYEDETEIENSNNRAPMLKNGLERNKRYITDPRLAKTAIKNAGYVCEMFSKVSGNHTTFDSTHGNKYLEAHHLIPMKAQKDFVSLGINLDRLENIVALCPTCHKAVHYGTRAEKIKYLKPLFESRIDKLKALGIDIEFDTLISDYY